MSKYQTSKDKKRAQREANMTRLGLGFREKIKLINVHSGFYTVSLEAESNPYQLCLFPYSPEFWCSIFLECLESDEWSPDAIALLCNGLGFGDMSVDDIVATAPVQRIDGALNVAAKVWPWVTASTEQPQQPQRNISSVTKEDLTVIVEWLRLQAAPENRSTLPLTSLECVETLAARLERISDK